MTIELTKQDVELISQALQTMEQTVMQASTFADAMAEAAARLTNASTAVRDQRRVVAKLIQASIRRHTEHEVSPEPTPGSESQA